MDSEAPKKDLKRFAFDKYNEGINIYYKTTALAAMTEALGHTAKETTISEDVFIGIGELLRENAVTVKSIAHALEDVSFELKD